MPEPRPYEGARTCQHCNAVLQCTNRSTLCYRCKNLARCRCCGEIRNPVPESAGWCDQCMDDTPHMRDLGRGKRFRCVAPDPEGWNEHLDELAERAAREEPLFT